ncbi:Mov34/MPN/PAD-1 family protein [Mediterraneibacter glycyrrhizinilyticus]|uniref:Mov34/MPN/PAD-1 family protein n=1 Tax=Mediterraneibacter glycyrrhizinilyticus TaxID=342942 RepID=UPI0019620EC4|nr:Mov34/MPN/PAD-1 family protein [Mediterraneibacter glycyrrhizinilyticus]MBM6751637.1 Mov34/MPN/PAD-1 family protein [Mediterraneibacter glycyrrhizinilyticus]
MTNTIFDSYEFTKIADGSEQTAKYASLIESVGKNKSMTMLDLYVSPSVPGLFIHVLLSISIPSRGVFDGMDIKNKEEILIFAKDNYPYSAPAILFVRNDFPTESIPHLNSGVSDTPIKRLNPCLYRGDIDEWFWQNGSDAYCDRVNAWFSDLVNGQLIKEDGYEIRRQEKTSGIVEVNFDFLEQIIDSFVKDRGYVFLAMGSRDGKYFKVYDHEYRPNKTEAFPCMFVFDRINVISKYNSTPLETGKDLRSFPCETRIAHGLRRFRAKFYNPNQKIDKVMVIMAVKRPLQIIGSFSEYEFITVLMHYDFETNPDIYNCPIEEMLTISSVSHEMIERLSGTESVKKEPLNIFGCGALGSNIAINLFRMGYIEQKLYDEDILYPHNLIRHFESNGLFIGLPKSWIMAYEMGGLLGKKVEYHQEDILKIDNLKEGIIVDSTASKRILYWELQNRKIRNRILRSEIYMGGKLGISLLEGKEENPDLMDLQIQLYKKALNNQAISQWLNYEEEENMPFHIGVGCSSDTMVLDAATISNHASIVPHLLKKYACSDRGMICLNFFDGDDLSNNHIEIYEATEMVVSQVDDWAIHIETEIQDKVSNYLNESKENAGLWIGMVDEKLHRITVVDTYIPPDNKRQKNKITMGKQGVREYIKDITTKTNGLLQYVGEWHTHAIGNGTPSSIDLKTFAETKPSNIAFLMTIFAPLKIRHWVIQEKE